MAKQKKIRKNLYDLNAASSKLRTPDAHKEESKPKTVKIGSNFSSLRGPNNIISKAHEESYNLKSRLLNRLSKSDSSINRNCNQVKPPAARSVQDISTNTCRKRSISGVDSKWKNKKTFPMTPMCLKRTICKSKAKRTKTTEELELEKIAQLQKELADHLKYNENSLRRLKLKVGVAPIQRNIPKKAEVSSRIKTLKEDTENGGNKAVGVAPSKNISAVIKNMRLRAQNKTLLVKSTDVQNMLETNKCLSNSSKKDIMKTQSLHLPCTCKRKDLLSKMPLSKQYDAHCGITFYHNRKKTTVVKPFSFDARVKEFTASMKKEVEKIRLSSSLQTPWPKDITKENFSPNKTSCSAEKFSFNPKVIKERAPESEKSKKGK
ncbi:uncharacterized protein LOC118185205 isoform X2 [Stegodyphus dumicola]|uniref:uncharacterized protein LOC118185205 isoform X2 n=1 Tax=Stegodyphus dumicola TaxID=202533 RepID=UPI0015AD2C13|nr:uncharacterized protein LOC118185205 isoform X2 [Stegodyphus dumicola]